MHAYTHIHTYIHTYTHTHIHTYLHTYIPTYLPTYLHTYLPTYIHTYWHTDILTYWHTDITLHYIILHYILHIQTYIHTHTHAHTHTRTHTHTHTHIQTHTHTYRQAGRQTDRHTDRQPDTQTRRHTRFSQAEASVFVGAALNSPWHPLFLMKKRGSADSSWLTARARTPLGLSVCPRTCTCALAHVFVSPMFRYLFAQKSDTCTRDWLKSTFPRCADSRTGYSFCWHLSCTLCNVMLSSEMLSSWWKK